MLGLLAGLLHACRNEVSGRSAPLASTSGWAFQYSPGMTQPNPDGEGGVYFDFPSRMVSILVHRRTSLLAGNMALRADVIISAGAKLIGPPDPKNTCPDPPHLSFYFQRRGDDFTAGKPNHRWILTGGRDSRFEAVEG
jgi:hypothetical protein